METIDLRVLRNGDDTFLIWQIKEAIPRCRGFELIRKLNGKEEVMPSHAGFEHTNWERGTQQPSTVWPVQKFMWTDYTVRSGDTVSYRVVAMTGPDKDHLKPDPQNASTWSDTISMDPSITRHVSCYFNRGVVASQWVQKMLGARNIGAKEKSKGDDVSTSAKARARLLDKVIIDLKEPKQRNALAGELRVGLLDLLKEAKSKKYEVYAALFELTDEELMNALADLGSRAFVVLADGAPPEKKKATDNDVRTTKSQSSDENSDARKLLKGSKVQVFDRMTKGKFLAHNKMLVVCDGSGKPRWTWTGSTNWTPTGLCTQANNGILIDDADLALDYKNQIIELSKNDGTSPAALAEANSTARPATIDGSPVRVWFTRTTAQQDMEDAKSVIAGAKHGALFLMFQTGAKGSLLEAIMNRQKEPEFFIHGVISNPPSTGGGKKGAGGPKPTPAEAVERRVAFVHKGERQKYAPDLLLPFANAGSDHWFAEFVKKNGAHAIVHSKIIVLDPFGPNPVVMTGSHNMGKTASSKNDENLVIIQGCKELAQAYAVNIMSIYDNYRWRYRLAAKSKWDGLHDNDTWQKYYLDDIAGEMSFWMR